MKQVNDLTALPSAINRLEVIGGDGRLFVKYFNIGVYVKLSYQDNDKTLKIFVSE
jgi:hypothetical protein